MIELEPLAVQMPKGPNPVDAFLREVGFQILARPAHRGPIWGLNGREFGEAEALEIARRDAPRVRAEKAAIREIEQSKKEREKRTHG